MWSLTRRTRIAIVLSLLLAGGAALRLHKLGASVLWVDEAESAINALTIVANGLPGDRFLGEPIYENTLVWQWPEHPEYEFRDLSYSDRGLAVYHSWIPLYAIAAAFRLAGVTPENARHGTPVRSAAADEIAHWTLVPRLPSVLFGLLLILASFRLGAVTGGDIIGLALALLTACSTFFVDAARQARYYSSALAVTAWGGGAVWLAWRRGRWIDHIHAGFAIGVLFHVHSVSAVAMAALYALAIPFGINQPKVIARIAAAGATAALLILPWAIWSGMLQQVQLQPPARQLLDVQMILLSLPRNPVLVVTLVLGLIWFGAALRPGSRLSPRWRQPVLDAAPVIAFALAWLFVSYLVYFVAMPAASFFPYRLRLTIAVPGALLLAIIVVALARQVRPNGWVSLATMAFLIIAAQQFSVNIYRDVDPALLDFLSQMRQWRLAPDARVYASPNEHLVLSYYSGRLVQSIAPIRREWLERFESDLVIIETTTYVAPPASAVQQLAVAHQLTLTPATMLARRREAVQLAKVQELEAVSARVESSVMHPRDAFDTEAVRLVHEWTEQAVRGTAAGTPLAASPRLRDWGEYRESFFYWFAGGQPRWGSGLNYASCRARAHAYVHPAGFAVLDCRRQQGRPLVPVTRIQAE